MAETAPIAVRDVRTVQLNLPDFRPFADHYGFSAPSVLSPLRDLLALGSKGQPRPIDALTAGLGDLGTGAVRLGLAPLVAPDRILDARVALFNSAPAPCWLYGSRRVGHFVALRLGMEFDRELLFPFNADDLEVWIRLQLQFSSGAPLPTVLRECSAQELAFLLALADAYKTAFVRSLDTRRNGPQPIELGAEDVLKAAADSSAPDRRWIAHALNEVLGILVHPGGLTGLRLPPVTGAVVRQEVDRWLQRGLLKPAAADSARFRLGPMAALFAGNLTAWINLVSLHDIQIVGGTDRAQAQEELLLFITTASTLWVLASDGLTRCTGTDLSPARFALRSVDLVTATEIAREFLKPLPNVAVPEATYAPAPARPVSAPARRTQPPRRTQPVERTQRPERICSRCGSPYTGSPEFCSNCGQAIEGAPAVAGPPTRRADACPKCGAPTSGKKFCTKCGTPVADAAVPPASPRATPKRCPKCGAPTSGTKFCTRCGTPTP